MIPQLGPEQLGGQQGHSQGSVGEEQLLGKTRSLGLAVLVGGTRGHLWSGGWRTE